AERGRHARVIEILKDDDYRTRRRGYQLHLFDEPGVDVAQAWGRSGPECGRRRIADHRGELWETSPDASVREPGRPRSDAEQLQDIANRRSIESAEVIEHRPVGGRKGGHNEAPGIDRHCMPGRRVRPGQFVWPPDDPSITTKTLTATFLQTPRRPHVSIRFR